MLYNAIKEHVLADDALKYPDLFKLLLSGVLGRQNIYLMDMPVELLRMKLGN